MLFRVVLEQIRKPGVALAVAPACDIVAAPAPKPHKKRSNS